MASNIDDFDYLNTPAEEPEVSRIIAPDSDEIERAAEAALGLKVCTEVKV